MKIVGNFQCRKGSSIGTEESCRETIDEGKSGKLSNGT
jgi:hypothetical protein